VLLPANATDMKLQIQVQAFEQELKKLGWLIDQNVEIEVRWATSDPSEIRKNAAELATLKPDVILTHGSSMFGNALIGATGTNISIFVEITLDLN